MDVFSQIPALLYQLWVFITTNPAGVGAAVGAVTPVLVSILARPNMTRRTRTILAIGSSVVLGSAVTLSNNAINSFGDYFTVLLALYTTCEAFYQKLYKGSGLAERIELATLPRSMKGTQAH